MEDSAIVALYWQRQETALSKTQEKYGRRLYGTAQNILRDDEDSKECVNDALFKAWQAIPPSRPELLGAFLVKITRNLAINRWKAKRADKRGGDEVDLLLSELQDCIPAAGGVEDMLNAAAVTEIINEYLQSLEQTARVIFVLRYFHGESLGDISRRFQMNENNVKSILFRARKKLKAQLEKEEVIV
ncbi:MAG: RNA polymerase sigma factor [Oscillospiraceae bacterium]|nr:RNA polymerase sigma factor [Oscillospiraceae bacterium]